MRARCRRTTSLFCLSVLFITPVAGCRNCDTVEMALRSREQDVRTLREELLRLQAYNAALQSELYAFRNQGALKITPELASQTYTLKRITLGPGTGGYDNDDRPGDESLQVVLQPRDTHDDIIKSPGKVQITALEVSPEGLKTPISSWSISADQVRNSWKQGLFSSGFSFVLPWQHPPRQEKIRVLVQFQLIDGRLFEVDKDVIIRLDPKIPLHSPRRLTPMPPLNPNLPGGQSSPQNDVPSIEREPANKGNGPPPITPGNSLPISDGPELRPAGDWQAAPLIGAVRLFRPEPLYPRAPPSEFIFP